MKMLVRAALALSALLAAPVSAQLGIKVSAMPSAGTLDGTEKVPVVQGGATRAATTAQQGAFTLGIAVPALPPAATLTGTEVSNLVQGGSAVRATVSDIKLGSLRTGAVLTRLRVPSGQNTSANTIVANASHIARGGIPVNSLQLGDCNFFANSSVHEAGSGYTATYQHRVEYPYGSGTWYTATWSGNSTSPVTADGAISALSDKITMPAIPDGAAIRIHTYAVWSGSGGLITYNGSQDMRATGDAVAAGNGIADTLTPSATAGAIYTPCRAVAPTRVASVAIWGHSREWGTGHVSDGSGDVGNAAPTIGLTLPYINLGVSGEQLQYMTSANMARRLPLMADYTHAEADYCINDVRVGSLTGAQCAALIPTFTALIGLPTVWETIYGSATSSDSWVTLANQTTGTADAERIAFNKLLLGGSVQGIIGVNDVAAALESAPLSGKWAIGNGGQSITIDGLHPNALGYATIRNAGAIKMSRFAR